jgi:putative transposase
MPSNIARQFFTIDVGSEVTWRSREFRITHILSVDTVLAVDAETGDAVRLSIDELRLAEPVAAAPAPGPLVGGSIAGEMVSVEKDLSEYGESEWRVAQRRLRAIKDLLDNPIRADAQVKVIAKREGVHAATLYRWLRNYTNAGHVSALVPATRGRRMGTKMLDAAVEAIIERAIEESHLHKQRRVAQVVADEVLRLCRLAKVVPPHPNSVRKRLKRLPPKLSLQRRGQKEEAINRFTPIRGSFPDATHPFAVVQIDHTRMDIIVVDEVHRKPVGRPWITLAIDVHSRMVAGIYISFDAPNAAAVGLCLAHAMCAKREYLAELGVAGNWPVWGRIGTVHCDNGKDFHSIALERGCQEHGIDLNWRPVKVPRYGGHIERLIGTVMRELHKLPGTTFSGIQSRRGYDSTKEAALTLREVEQHVIEFIVNVYHQRVHTELGGSPLRKWETGIRGDGEMSGTGIMPMPHDPARIALDFMPIFERTIQRYGIRMDGITYYEPTLDPYINALDPHDAQTKRKFIVRRDPRDISKVYFFDPTAKRYCVVPYLNLGHPSTSVGEINQVRRKLREEGRRNVDEGVIFEALDRMRDRVADATQKSKAARRQVQRNPAYRSKVQSGETTAPAIVARFASPNVSKTVDQDDDDLFSEAVVPFGDISVRR